MSVRFEVLGPVRAVDAAGPIALRGPRHRAVLARLIVARGHVVPVGQLVDDLWTAPPPGAVGAVRTFVAALRRALEPDRPPRAAPALLVTDGPGYALRTEDVDAWRFQHAVADRLPAADLLVRLDEALAWWRGPAYAEFVDEPWARAERSRLAELRLQAVERRAEAQLALGRAGAAVADLDGHVAEHPWRETGWALLARALHADNRQGDALAVLRRARAALVDQLGVDPGPELRRAEAEIRHPAPGAEGVWTAVAAVYDRTVAPGARARLESTVGLLSNLAVTGGRGLEAAREHRMAAVSAAEGLGDAELVALVIGAYDVPAIWTRSDDPAQAAQVVAAAERALSARPSGATRARLLATIALESRGTGSARAHEAAREAERVARRLDDPALLAFALNAVFMQTFARAGLAPERDRIGAELVAVSARHGLVTHEVLGHLVRMQAGCALADVAGADRHAAAADRLAQRHELPLVAVLTRWYRALRLALTGAAPEEVEAAYRAAAAGLDGTGMPGLRCGLLPLALLSVRGEPVPRDDFGPYEPWARPLVLLAGDRPAEAAAALSTVPEPPRDLLCEAMWCLVARAAVVLDDRSMLHRARTGLAPAAGEWAGAGSGMLTLGPVAHHLAEIDAALAHT